jgi:hypothetical protein
MRHIDNNNEQVVRWGAECDDASVASWKQHKYTQVVQSRSRHACINPIVGSFISLSIFNIGKKLKKMILDWWRGRGR